MAILLSLVSALLYGIADYVGGRVSRRVSSLPVLLVADSSTWVVLVIAVPLLSAAGPTSTALIWGGAAGLAGVAGVLALYRGLAEGSMAIVAPITAVVAAVIPVVVGLGLGERPDVLALVGIVLALGAVVLISGSFGLPSERISRRLLVLATIAGVGFGLLFVFFDLAGEDGGWWPVLAARTVAIPIEVVALIALGSSFSRGPAALPRRLDRYVIGSGITIGALGTLANIAYLAATRRGLLSVVAVVVSLYPASTVLLATAIDGERIRPLQAVGLLVATAALVMVSLGH